MLTKYKGAVKTDEPVLFPIGQEDEVVNIHPRAMFIPQNGWTFLAAGTTINNVLLFIGHLYF